MANENPEVLGKRIRKTQSRSQSEYIPDGDEVPIERLPPNSLEAEQGVLGCIMLSPQSSLSICVDRFKPGDEVFYDLRHKRIYQAALSLWDSSKPVDTITIMQLLSDGQMLEMVGGVSYLASLPDKTPSAENLDYYIEILIKKFVLRKMIVVCSDLASMAAAEPSDITSLLGSASSAIQNVTDSTLVSSSVKTAGELAAKVEATIEGMLLNSGKITGIATGFVDLDQMTWGLHPSEMFVIAARPGTGKTALALNIADYVAIELNEPVGIFSLEMSDESLMMRALCSRARVSMTNVRKAIIGDLDKDRLIKARLAMHKAPLYIDDSGGLSVLQLRAKARRMQQQYGIKLFIVDYLQLMHATVRKSDNRQHEVSEISSGLKNLAKELKVPVIVLSQLNRKMEDRGPDAAPKLSDLRESGSIEQDADVVAMLYRQGSKVDQEDQYSDVVKTTLLIAKSRNGPTGNVDLMFIKSATKFESAAPKYQQQQEAAQDYEPTLHFPDP